MREAVISHIPGRVLTRALLTTFGSLPERLSKRELVGLDVRFLPLCQSLRDYLSRPIAAMVVTSEIKNGNYRQRIARYCERHRFYETLVEYFDQLIVIPPVDERIDVVRLKHEIHRAVNEVKETFSLGPARMLGSPLRGEQKKIISNHMIQPFGLKQSEKKGGLAAEASADHRRRGAFNSPFFPFVLVASQAGEEGLDFHRYCSTVVHWDVTADPAAMIQREGRIYRYRCLALRNSIRSNKFPREFIWQNYCPDANAEDEMGQANLPASFSRTEAKIDREMLILPFTEEEHRYERFRESLYYFRLLLGDADPRALQRRLDRDLLHLNFNQRREVLEKLRECWINLSAPRTT